jgi:hypothetical protein
VVLAKTLRGFATSICGKMGQGNALNAYRCTSDDAIIIWLLVVGRRRWLRACGIGMAG